ncbi:MAG: choice-of-anchor E domain-containing protein [Planctomycetes bacterium]|nr:choice-of-anchor E domain-containing protein [Planctomycetota bacterium]
MKLLPTTLLALLVCSASLQAGVPTQQVCFTDTIPLQPTNWGSSVSVPKFNPNLGQLVSITFRLTGNVQGTARAESLDAAPTIVNTSFQAQITLTRPDLSALVVTLPVANFSDSFTAFDGAIDFGGTSGITHGNINVSDTQQSVSPPPASDLLLFTGPGNIVLPVSANGSSIATGAGNLITQFTTDAAASVEVCYTYLPNTPPSLSCPGPLMASVGVPLQFQICASDVDAGDIVTIDVSNAPAGMTFNPPLPASGNPVCVTVDWTPGPFQVGDFDIVFSAIDTRQRTAACTVRVTSAECHLLISGGPGSSSATIFGHLYHTQLRGVRAFFPVTMEDMPVFAWHQIPTTMTVQVVMYNPQIFPQNPDQHSQAMRITKAGYGVFQTEYFGTTDGIGVNVEVTWHHGQPRVRFPFTIQGM